jgi:hypothetical protein
MLFVVVSIFLCVTFAIGFLMSSVTVDSTIPFVLHPVLQPLPAPMLSMPPHLDGHFPVLLLQHSRQSCRAHVVNFELIDNSIFGQV